MRSGRGIIRGFFAIILISIVFQQIPVLEEPILINTPELKQTKNNINISFGQEILIKKKLWLNDRDQNLDNSDEDNIPWKNRCFNNWNLKEQGTLGDNNSLRDFVAQCLQDAEAGIYFNNQEAQNSGKPIIKIAVSVPISISNGVFTALELLKGVELAQRKINRNRNNIKIDDNTQALLEVGIIDEGWNSQVDNEIEALKNRGEKEKEKIKSQLVASHLADSDVVGVIGHFSSDALEAAAPIYRKNKLVAISPTSTARRKRNKRNKVLAHINNLRKTDESLRINNYIFRTTPNDIVAIKKLITGYVKPKKINKVIVVYDATSKFSRLYKQEFQRQFKDQEHEVMNLSLDSDNCAFKFDNNGRIDRNRVDDCVKVIANNEPDAILIAFSTANALQLKASPTNQTVDFFKLIENKIGYIPQLLGADSVYKEGFSSETESGMIVSVPMARQMRNFNSPVNPEMEEIEVNWRTSMTYDATIAIVKSIEHKNSQKCVNLDSNKDKCRQQIRKNLTSRQFVANGMAGDGSIKFDNNGDRKVDNNNLAVLLEVRNGFFEPYNP